MNKRFFSKMIALWMTVCILLTNVSGSLIVNASEISTDRLYTVFVNETQNGTVTVNGNEVNYITLGEGEQVTVEAIPDNGYRTVSITAYNSNNTAIAAESNCTLSFEMIEDDVTIDVIFTENSLSDSQAQAVVNGADAEDLQRESYEPEETTEESSTEEATTSESITEQVEDETSFDIHEHENEIGLCDVLDVTNSEVINTLVASMNDYLGTSHEDMNDEQFITTVLSEAGNQEVSDLSALINDNKVKTTIYEGSNWLEVALNAMRHSEAADIFYVESIENNESIYAEWGFYCGDYFYGKSVNATNWDADLACENEDEYWWDENYIKMFNRWWHSSKENGNVLGEIAPYEASLYRITVIDTEIQHKLEDVVDEDGSVTVLYEDEYDITIKAGSNGKITLYNMDHSVYGVINENEQMTFHVDENNLNCPEHLYAIAEANDGYYVTKDTYNDTDTYYGINQSTYGRGYYIVGGGQDEVYGIEFSDSQMTDSNYKENQNDVEPSASLMCPGKAGCNNHKNVKDEWFGIIKAWGKYWAENGEDGDEKEFSCDGKVQHNPSTSTRSYFSYAEFKLDKDKKISSINKTISSSESNAFPLVKCTSGHSKLNPINGTVGTMTCKAEITKDGTKAKAKITITFEPENGSFQQLVKTMTVTTTVTNYVRVTFSKGIQDYTDTLQNASIFKRDQNTFISWDGATYIDATTYEETAEESNVLALYNELRKEYVNGGEFTLLYRIKGQTKWHQAPLSSWYDDDENDAGFEDIEASWTDAQINSLTADNYESYGFDTVEVVNGEASYDPDGVDNAFVLPSWDYAVEVYEKTLPENESGVVNVTNICEIMLIELEAPVYSAENGGTPYYIKTQQLPLKIRTYVDLPEDTQGEVVSLEEIKTWSASSTTTDDSSIIENNIQVYPLSIDKIAADGTTNNNYDDAIFKVQPYTYKNGTLTPYMGNKAWYIKTLPGDNGHATLDFQHLVDRDRDGNIYTDATMCIPADLNGTAQFTSVFTFLVEEVQAPVGFEINPYKRYITFNGNQYDTTLTGYEYHTTVPDKKVTGQMSVGKVLSNDKLKNGNLNVRDIVFTVFEHSDTLRRNPIKKCSPTYNPATGTYIATVKGLEVGLDSSTPKLYDLVELAEDNPGIEKNSLFDSSKTETYKDGIPLYIEEPVVNLGDQPIVNIPDHYPLKIRKTLANGLTTNGDADVNGATFSITNVSVSTIDIPVYDGDTEIISKRIPLEPNTTFTVSIIKEDGEYKATVVDGTGKDISDIIPYMISVVNGAVEITIGQDELGRCYLPISSWSVKETAAGNSTTVLNEKPQILKVTGNETSATFTWVNEECFGGYKIKKTSISSKLTGTIENLEGATIAFANLSNGNVEFKTDDGTIYVADARNDELGVVDYLHVKGTTYDIEDPSTYGNLFTIVTDADGNAQTPQVTYDDATRGKHEVFPSGSYKAVEILAPKGFQVNKDFYEIFTINKNTNGIVQGSTGLVETVNGEVIDEEIFGGVQIWKYDKSIGYSEISGGLNSMDETNGNDWKDVEFDIYNISKDKDGNPRDIVHRYADHETGEIKKEFVAYGEKVTTISVKWNEEVQKHTAETGKEELSFGDYEIKEVRTSAGYIITDITPRKFSVDKQGEYAIPELTAEQRQIITDSIKDGTNEENYGKVFMNTPKRGDFFFEKVISTINDRVHTLFILTNSTTGESHVIATDLNGIYDTREWGGQKNTNNTNCLDYLLETYDPANPPIVMDEVEAKLKSEGKTMYCGLWMSKTQSGYTAPVVDSNDSGERVGSLPFGQYTLTEMSTDTNAGYKLITFEFYVGEETKYTDITKELFSPVNLGTLDDATLEPEMKSYAFEAETNEQYIHIGQEVTIKDKVTITQALDKGKTYILKTAVVDKKTGNFIKDINGNTYAEKEFEAVAESGIQYTEFTINAANYGDRDIVVYEYLYEKGADSPFLTHTDINDVKQTLHVFGFQTEATDNETGTHYGNGEATEHMITDKVSYDGLNVGTEYTIKGTLYDKTTNLPFLDINGNEVHAEKTFVCEKESGTETVTFTFRANMKDTTIVVFEDLYDGDKLVASHADIEDENQTVYYPYLHTTANDNVTHSHYGKLTETKEYEIVDKVDYYNLEVGKQYTIKGILMDKATNKPFIDINGNEVVAEKIFTASKTNGTENITFTFKTDKVGFTTVVFEDLYATGKLLATHEDIEDAEQTVYYYDLQTEATENGSHFGNIESEEHTIIDKVAYSGLTIGKTYTVKGKLMDKDTGAPFKDSEGKEVTATKTFVADKVSGYIHLEFKFKAVLSAKQIVVFEDLYEDNRQIATHADLEDENQTVWYPQIKTTAVDNHTRAHFSENAEGDHCIIDTVSYYGLEPNKEYEIRGYLMNAVTGKRILDKDGSEVTSSVKFTPSGSNGTQEVIFNWSGDMTNITTVVFEEIYYGEFKVAQHKDLSDKGQTVTFERGLKTYAFDQKTQDHVGDSTTKKHTIIDRVYYWQLSTEKTYTVKGTLYDKETGKPYKDAKGKEVHAEKNFKPATTDGFVELEFTFKAKNTAFSVVVFEDLYEGEEKLITHADIEDEDQSVYYPSLHTTAKDGETNTHTGSKTSKVLIDKVKYSNLVVGQEYELKGVLMDQKTKKPIKVNGEKITATKTFVPETPNGTVEMVFDIEGANLHGKIVVFEDLFYQEYKIASHSDINDKSQTVEYPGETTTTEIVETGDILMLLIIILIIGIIICGVAFTKKRFV